MVVICNQACVLSSHCNVKEYLCLKTVLVYYIFLFDMFFQPCPLCQEITEGIQCDIYFKMDKIVNINTEVCRMPFSDHVVANVASVCPPCYGPPCYTILIGIVHSDKCQTINHGNIHTLQPYFKCDFTQFQKSDSF